MGITHIVNAILDEMNQRVDGRNEMEDRVESPALDIRIVLTVIRNIEQGVRVAPLECAIPNKVDERVEASRCDLWIFS